MIFKKAVCYFIIFISSSVLVFFIAGFADAMKISYDAGTAVRENSSEISSSSNGFNAVLKKKNTISISLIGDSIAQGVGDTKGKGFSVYLPDSFKNLTSKDVTVNNAGIAGLHIPAMLERMKFFVNEWNYGTESVVEKYKSAVFIPTYWIFKFNESRFIAADGLHPNSAGYQVISGMIVRSIENFIVNIE